MQSVLSSQILALTLQRRAMSKRFQKDQLSREYVKGNAVTTVYELNVERIVVVELTKV